MSPSPLAIRKSNRSSKVMLAKWLSSAVEQLFVIWGQRHFVVAAVRSDFHTRYARSSLGFLWSILQPLAMAGILAFVLSDMLGAKVAGGASGAGYPVYLLVGMGLWSLFNEIMMRSLNVFIEYGALMKKISFPKVCLPIIVISTALVNHGLYLFAMVVVFAALGHFPQLHWLSLPLIAAHVCLLSISLGLLLGVFNVFLRDVSQVVAVFMQGLFWLTPIVYAVELLPPQRRWLIEWNPLAGLVQAYQDILFHGRTPGWSSLIWPACISVLLAMCSVFIFYRAQSELVDEL